MDLRYVAARQAYVVSLAGDPEAAHLAEDKLYQEVLSAIADGAENPADLARIALNLRFAEFPRWYA